MKLKKSRRQTYFKSFIDFFQQYRQYIWVCKICFDFKVRGTTNFKDIHRTNHLADLKKSCFASSNVLKETFIDLCFQVTGSFVIMSDRAVLLKC